MLCQLLHILTSSLLFMYMTIAIYKHDSSFLQYMHDWYIHGWYVHEWIFTHSHLLCHYFLILRYIWMTTRSDDLDCGAHLLWFVLFIASSLAYHSDLVYIWRIHLYIWRIAMGSGGADTKERYLVEYCSTGCCRCSERSCDGEYSGGESYLRGSLVIISRTQHGVTLQG